MPQDGTTEDIFTHFFSFVTHSRWLEAGPMTLPQIFTLSLIKIVIETNDMDQYDRKKYQINKHINT